MNQWGCKDKQPRKQRKPIGWSKIDKRGYVWVKTGNGQSYRKRAWIVMEQTLGRPLQPDEEVHHINGIKGDDQPENLEVLTKSQHSSITASEQHRNGNLGQATWKHANPHMKLTEDDVRAIREATGPHQEIARRYGVHKSTISGIKTRRVWDWLE